MSCHNSYYPPETIPQRLPTPGESIELKCLISSPHLNGKRGQISTYVPDPDDIHRYRVNIHLDDGTKQVIAVNSKNISLLNDSSNSSSNFNENKNLTPSIIRGGDSFYYCPDWDIVHVLIPCHVDSERCCAQFRQCINSLSYQTGRCRIFVSISGLPQFRQDALIALRMAAVSSIGDNTKEGGRQHQWFVIEDTVSQGGKSNNTTTKSQYQHWKSLLSASMDVNPKAWLMFLDNSDMCHPLRIQLIQEKVKIMQGKFKDREKVFCTSGKILINDGKCKAGDVALPIEHFLNGDHDFNGTSTNGDKHSLEYRDYYVHSNFFKDFLETTSSEVPPNATSFNLRFTDTVMSIIPPPPCFTDPNQNWMYVHYSRKIVDALF